MKYLPKMATFWLLAQNSRDLGSRAQYTVPGSALFSKPFYYLRRLASAEDSNKFIFRLLINFLKA